MNIRAIIDGVLDREQEGTPPYLAKGDAGLRTSWGISERAHPEAWVHGPPTRAQAFAIYLNFYVTPLDPLVPFVPEAFIAALVDDAVLSGGNLMTAVKRLQAVLGQTIDGILGPQTIRALHESVLTQVLQRYVVERAVRITRLVQRRPTDLINLTGWIVRILSFLPEAAA